MLIGRYDHNVDAKGRVSMPAKFRDDLGGHFVLSRGRGECLQAYSVEEWNKFETELLALKGAAANVLKQFFFSNSIECEIDSLGRVLLPTDFRNYAGITREVSFVGMSDHIEIWDKAQWDKHTEKPEFTPQGIEELMESLGL